MSLCLLTKIHIDTKSLVADLREHAIFTLHSLLKDNIENQRFVDSVKPSQEWAADGTLRSRVGAKILK